jgi:hypothetical protein
MADVLDRVKILTMRALELVREACSPLNLAGFEWSIANGWSRLGGDAHAASAELKFSAARRASLHVSDEATANAIYNKFIHKVWASQGAVAASAADVGRARA